MLEFFFFLHLKYPIKSLKFVSQVTREYKDYVQPFGKQAGS